MPKIELRIPRRVLKRVDMIARVDDVSRDEVIRLALRDWLKDIDMDRLERELADIEAEECEEEVEDEEDDEDEESEDEDDEEDDDEEEEDDED